MNTPDDDNQSLAEFMKEQNQSEDQTHKEKLETARETANQSLAEFIKENNKRKKEVLELLSEDQEDMNNDIQILENEDDEK